MSLAAAVAGGRLEGLRALRDVLAAELESQDEKSQTAALARQLREVLKDIAELEKAVPKGSVVDDLAARRKTRSAVSAGDEATDGSGAE